MYKRLISIGSFELFRLVQAMWAFLLTGLLLLLVFLEPGLLSRSGFYLIVTCLYLVASWFVFLNRRWAWIVSLTFLVGYWILGALGAVGGIPFVDGLTVLLAARHLLDVNPLGAALVVAHAVVFIVPPFCLLVLAGLCADGIVRALRRQPMPTSDP
jgi:hypothetical protein